MDGKCFSSREPILDIFISWSNGVPGVGHRPGLLSGHQGVEPQAVKAVDIYWFSSTTVGASQRDQVPMGMLLMTTLGLRQSTVSNMVKQSPEHLEWRQIFLAFVSLILQPISAETLQPSGLAHVTPSQRRLLILAHELHHRIALFLLESNHHTFSPMRQPWIKNNSRCFVWSKKTSSHVGLFIVPDRIQKNMSPGAIRRPPPTKLPFVAFLDSKTCAALERSTLPKLSKMLSKYQIQIPHPEIYAIQSAQFFLQGHTQLTKITAAEFTGCCPRSSKFCLAIWEMFFSRAVWQVFK